MHVLKHAICTLEKVNPGNQVFHYALPLKDTTPHVDKHFPCKHSPHKHAPHKYSPQKHAPRKHSPCKHPHTNTCHTNTHHANTHHANMHHTNTHHAKTHHANTILLPKQSPHKHQYVRSRKQTQDSTLMMRLLFTSSSILLFHDMHVPLKILT
jgi:hypothetical protein